MAKRNPAAAAQGARPAVKEFPKTRAALLEAAREAERQKRNMASGKPPAVEPPASGVKE